MALDAIAIPPNPERPVDGAIVLLHGWGANARDLAGLIPLLDLPNYQFFCLDAPLAHPYVPLGRMWYDLEREDEAGLNQSRQQLNQWLDRLETEIGIARSRTILAGFSQGGAMTLDVGVTRSFAGLISMSGYLHATPQPTTDRCPSILMTHGTQDPVIPLSLSYQARDTLSKLGMDVRYREYEMGHEIRPEVIELARSFVVEVMSES